MLLRDARYIFMKGTVTMTVEPQTGFEPAFHAWKARALPFELLRHVCILFQLSQSVAACKRPGSDFRVCGVTCSVVPQVYRSESVRLPRMGATQQYHQQRATRHSAFHWPTVSVSNRVTGGQQIMLRHHALTIQPRSALMQTPRAYLPACGTPYYKQ